MNLIRLISSLQNAGAASGAIGSRFVSDVISHLLTKDEMPSGAELRLFVRISGGGLSTVVTPGILFLLAWLGVLDIGHALIASSVIYIVTLAVIARLAVRKSDLSRGMRLVVLAMLVGLGLAVIGLQVLAKSV